MTVSEGGKRLISELHSLLVQAQPEPPVAWPHHRFYHLGPNLSIWRLLCNRRFYIWGQNNSDAQSSTEQSSSHAAIKLYVSSDQTVSKDPVWRCDDPWVESTVSASAQEIYCNKDFQPKKNTLCFLFHC